MEIECYDHWDHTFKCYHSEKNEQHLWPTFIGIGPAKSGSSSMHRAVASHKNVAIGELCTSPGECSPELHALDTVGRDFLTLNAVTTYFNVTKLTNNKKVLAVGEKTPHYASSDSAPYIAHALLGPNLRLIYTIREPVEEDLSWYNHRHASGLDVDFPTWVNDRIEFGEAMLSCKRSAVTTFAVPRFNGTENWLQYDDLFDADKISWQDARRLELALASKCNQKLLNKNAKFGSILEYNHFFNLKRWLHVFGSSNFLCVQDIDQLCNNSMDRVLEKVAVLLGLPLFLPQPEYNFSSTGYSRLFNGQMETYKLSEKSINTAVKKLSAAYSRLMSPSQQKWIREVCPHIE